MCMGIPMQVLSTRPGFARVRGRGEEKDVNTALIGEAQPGDWLLVFIDDAREQITTERAAEVNAALDLVASAMAGLGLQSLCDDPGDLGFALPSTMSPEQLAALTGQ